MSEYGTKEAPPSYSNPGYEAPPSQGGYYHQQQNGTNHQYGHGGHHHQYPNPQYNVPQGTVVTNQPIVVPQQQHGGTTVVRSVTEVVTSQPVKQWQTPPGSWCCGQSMKTCLCAWFNPCYQCGLSKRMNEHCCIGCATCPGGLASMRAVIRTRHNIEGTLCGDHCSSYWCRPCVMIQMSDEMDHFGYPKQNCPCCC